MIIPPHSLCFKNATTSHFYVCHLPCTLNVLVVLYFAPICNSVLASSHGDISSLLRTSLVWSSKMSKLDGVLMAWSRSFLAFRLE